MRFTKNGPDIPEQLLQAHEDDRVVFFCGSGISRPAGLPDFEGLSDRLYKATNQVPNAVQRAALEAKRFDVAIGLLEDSLLDGRMGVRKAAARILNPGLFPRESKLTHEALLTLATESGAAGTTVGSPKRIRLVTTNFDRLFEEAGPIEGCDIKVFRAPFFPTPKRRWRGLVYLHGLLDTEPTDENLNQLVLTSGDFGIAYLTERWAARFVSELFRNFTVCFVGYSLEDPVLRYMTDALAADRVSGESLPEVFAFGAFGVGQKGVREDEWRAKSVIPILYEDDSDHRALHETLREWARAYRDGVHAKVSIVAQSAATRPTKSTSSDYFIGRMLWALSDKTGIPAKQFAEFDPLPSIEWLEFLEEPRFGHADLLRFGVTPERAKESSLKFSLLRRPSSYLRSPWMSLVEPEFGRLDGVLRNLSSWLSRHADDPKLLIWIARDGGIVHPEFERQIRERLKKGVASSSSKSTAASGDSENSKSEVRPLMKKLWGLMFEGYFARVSTEDRFHYWLEDLASDGPSLSLRLRLREVLKPRVGLQQPLRLVGASATESASNRISDLVRFEIKLASELVHYELPNLAKHQNWLAWLPDLVAEFRSLLLDVVRLDVELRDADEAVDVSFVHRPSISDHDENRNHSEWTALITLLRDSWRALAMRSKREAQLEADLWMSLPYPLFKRMALYAATVDSLIPPGRALGWLLADDSRWLWTLSTKREAAQLIRSLAPRLNSGMLSRLENAILAGPPRDLYRTDLGQDRFQLVSDQETWARLSILREVRPDVSPRSVDKLRLLVESHPSWSRPISPDEELAYRLNETGSSLESERTPRRRRDLEQWLDARLKSENAMFSDWQQRCRDDFSTTACALYAIARRDHWPADFWRNALAAWSDEALLARSWRYLAPTLANAPLLEVTDNAHSIGWWLQATAKSSEGHDAEFFLIARRLLLLRYPDELPSNDPVARAINHPVGLAIGAVLRRWHRDNLEDDVGIRGDTREILTLVCDRSRTDLQHGRVLLAAHIVTLFRVDRVWVSEHLLPCLDWFQSKSEAPSAWQGLLWSPRLHLPLFEVLKGSFLETAKHYTELGDHAKQYASLLVSAALFGELVFSPNELMAATAELPSEGLVASAAVLASSIDTAGDHRTAFWKHRALPYLREIWPKTKAHSAPAVGTGLARVCIAAHENFSEAVGLLRAWLAPIDQIDHTIHGLERSGLCSIYPVASLEFLGLIEAERFQWSRGALSRCLDSIRTAQPSLEADTVFRRLSLRVQEN